MLHNNLCTSRLNLLRFQKLRIFQNFDLFYTNTTTFSLKFAQISRNFGATPKKLTIFVKNFKLKCLSIYFLFSIFPIIFRFSENSTDFFCFVEYVVFENDRNRSMCGDCQQRINNASHEKTLL